MQNSLCFFFFYEWRSCSKVLHFIAPTMNSVNLNCFSSGVQYTSLVQTWYSALHVCTACYAFIYVCVCWWCATLSLCFVCVPPAAGVSTAVGLPAAAPAGPAGPAAASAQPSEARTAHDPAGTDRPAAALPHSGSVPNITALYSATLACSSLTHLPCHQSTMGTFQLTKHNTQHPGFLHSMEKHGIWF